MDVIKNINDRLTNINNILRLRKQMKLIIISGILGYTVSFLFNFYIYRKISKILEIIEKKYDDEKCNK
jgi:hypothetical protein